MNSVEMIKLSIFKDELINHLEVLHEEQVDEKTLHVIEYFTERVKELVDKQDKT